MGFRAGFMLSLMKSVLILLMLVASGDRVLIVTATIARLRQIPPVRLDADTLQ